MKQRPHLPACIVILCFCYFSSFGQEPKKLEEKFSPHSSIGLVLGHAQVFNGRDAEGKRIVLSLPSWGIDYNYYVSPKLAIGLHTDIITETFVVDGHGSEELERSTPIAPAIMGIYKPCKHWSFLLGAGEEFAKEGNYFLNRLGLEYGAEIHNAWEVTGSLGYDIKWNVYDSWLIGIGISKSFGGHKNKESHKAE